jgi:hypothetical protein
VIRVMAQGEDETLLASVVDDICEAILAVAYSNELVETSMRAAE